MKKALATLATLFVVGFTHVVACPHGERSPQTPYRRPSTLLTPPSRPLVWGDVNIIHTTDTHGWLLGHKKSSSPEPNYSGTFGDFYSFVYHMNETAKQKNVDLLLVDTGDLNHGNGLSDGYTPGPGEWDGKDSDELFARLPYDVLTIGNHELYWNEIAHNMHDNFAKKKFPGLYLTSNAYINITNADGKNETVPIGHQFAKFKTRLGRKVTALGVIFNVRNLASNVSVHPAEDMAANEPWFANAIEERPDFFLLTGHMPLRGSDNYWNFVFDPIRKLHPDTPILVLGGHTHIRDCVQWDGKSMALESGAYMDTVGWLSVNLTSSNPSGNLSFSRRYLDPNRLTYTFHTTSHDFDTVPGLKLTDDLNTLFNKFNLGTTWGESPQHYTLWSDPAKSNNSALKLFAEEVVPKVLSNFSSAAQPKYFIIGAGVLRYDVFKGEFDQNDQLAASPYRNQFWCIPNVPLGAAKATAQRMDITTASAAHTFSEPRDAWRRDLMEVDEIRQRWLKEMSMHPAPELLDAEQPQTLGYVTSDDCGARIPGDGDDTPHQTMKDVYTDLPNVVTSRAPPGGDDTLVDLVFLDFNKKSLLLALNAVQSHNYTEEHILKKYTNIKTNEVLGIYAQKEWPVRECPNEGY